VPSTGEVLNVDDLVVEVLDAERRRVHRLRVWRLADAPGAGREGADTSGAEGAAS
jgi:CBS domain containing-hemolysin-like protein